MSQSTNPAACDKHQNEAVYGKYGQRGCLDCVDQAAKLIQDAKHRTNTELHSEDNDGK